MIFSGNLIEHIAKVAMEANKEFITETLPLYDIIRKEAETFLSILSTRGIKSYTVGLVVPNGRPRYVKGIEATVQPIMSAISLVLFSDRLIGIMLGFWKLIVSPVEVAYF